jgi:predicted esterase YcpF (UPF0227 family)
VQVCVQKVLYADMNEDKAIAILQKQGNELRRQREMAKSNWECRKKINER